MSLWLTTFNWKKKNISRCAEQTLFEILFYSVGSATLTNTMVYFIENNIHF